MKNYILTFALFVGLFACKEEKKEAIESTEEVAEVTYKSVGKKIIADDTIEAKSMVQHYEGLKAGDSIDTKMTIKVKEVCQAKGCWMTAEMANGKELRVKFKDYAFFMPKDIAGQDVIINGKAFVKELPVDELRHYAEDAGKSKEEIEAITKPERTYSFLADGVLIAEK